MNHKAIWDTVEQFRNQHTGLHKGNLPLDVLLIADVGLGLDFVALKGLERDLKIDALISADFSEINIDEDHFKRFDQLPPFLRRRVRFSIAHEVGHYVLHRTIPDLLKIRDLENWRLWTKDYFGKRYRVEEEANEFAGRLLVPFDRLSAELNYWGASASPYYPDWKSREGLRNEFCEYKADLFDVNPITINMRLSREHLWPEIR